MNTDFDSIFEERDDDAPQSKGRDPLLYIGNSKRCSKCGKYKDMATEYDKDNTGRHKNGVVSRCKDCRSRAKYQNDADWFWKRFWQRVIRVGECLEWRGGHCYGYPRCKWRGKRAMVRRVVYSLSVGDLKDDEFVIMTCENKKCVNRYHMSLATKEDMYVIRCNNAARGDSSSARTHPERVARGARHGSQTHPEQVPRGARHGTHTHPENFPGGAQHLFQGTHNNNAKLTDDDVRVIRRLRTDDGLPLKAVADRFGISISTVSAIALGITWKHVQ
jgi:hypothetical protein